MDKKLKAALKQNFMPPTPQRRDAFVKQLNTPKARPIEVFRVQATYMSKRFWIGTFALFIIVALVIQYTKMELQEVGYISALLPLLSLLGITEIYKSIAHNMAELELACKYNLGKVMLIRMLIVGGVSSLLLFTLIMLSRNVGFGIYRNALYFTLPYLLSSYLSLVVINRFKLRENNYVCAGISILIATMQMVCTNLKLYLLAYAELVWLSLLVMIGILLVKEMIQLKKQMEELTWSLS